MKVLFQTSDSKIFGTEAEAQEHEAKLLPIVVIDDDEDLAEIISDKLKKHGYGKVISFTNPIEATNFIKNNGAYHVFSDYNMPAYGVNGKWIFDLCQEKNIPFTYISADASIPKSISKIEFIKDTAKVLETLE